ncbi:MAG: glycosyltransferase family 39 protein, partial [Bacteroidales bacterium]|nr:glycosyltransferase family 39 protein [Bacteroidales bacterium]
MNRLILYLRSNNLALYIIAIILLFPALFINLGLLPLITDEPTRGIVALEMTLTDNYFVPTINGEFYYNKPPLYNWILILSTKLCGGFSEFALRLPTVISLLLFGFLIFVFVRKHYGYKIAILNALILITGGRILFWDSFQGLIDIFYSTLVFLSFMLIYHFYQKSKFYYLFLFSYLITVLGFLMKGMPSLLFQGLTLLVFFIYMKNWKKLFSLAHFTGIFLFALIIGSYYYTYYQ